VNIVDKVRGAISGDKRIDAQQLVDRLEAL
jgi:hypothetical protein